jgi:omega-hydroxy-beta-dihydromenaquinone-9 sulfotransferase
VLQRMLLGGAAISRPLAQAPVFILGHWRTGTTLLHELLGCDPRHAFPTTYHCFAPHDFLITGSWLPELLGRLMPAHRPMDPMAVGWDRPQEDEFALLLLGQPSPYRRLAFPNQPSAGVESFDLESLPARQIHLWKTCYLRFLQTVSCAKNGRRLILKSPPHMCRIPTLVGMFPDARFVHIIRDPYDVYPSTLHLWRSLWSVQALQQPTWIGLKEYILETFTHMYKRLEAGKRLIPSARYCEVRYEELVRDPLGQVEAIYRAVDLGDFLPARPFVARYVAGLKGYQTNRYLLTPAEQQLISRCWGEVIRRYGYAIRCS